MGRYFLKFSYLGTRYRGLQKNVIRFNETIRDPDTIQGAIEDALATLIPKCSEWPKITLSSRTDIGVHALCSTAHVDLHNNHNCLYDPNRVLTFVNRYFFKCKHDIRLLEFIPVTTDFHARHFAKSRTYVYRFMRAKDQNEYRIPISETSHAYHLRSETFDIERLERATQLFMGIKDFRTFSAEARANKPIQYVRQLDAFTVEKGQPLMPFDPLCQNFDFWNITCKARSFLYNQVRRMVAALINVGTGRLTEREITIMLQVPNHRNWDPRIQIVPAHGLYLANIEYSQEELDKCIIEFKESADSNYPNTSIPIYANELSLNTTIHLLRMDLKSLIENKKSRLKSCKTVVTTPLGQRYEKVNGEKRELPAATPFVVDDKPDLQVARVTPGLFLSSQDPVANIEILQEYEILRILSIGVEATVKFDGIKYYYCDLLDLPESDISVTIEKCGKIINENRGENILVHCNAGVSRSPAIVISYLMTAEKLSYSEAYDTVKKVRNCIKPNDGFVKQLKMLQAVSD